MTRRSARPVLLAALTSLLMGCGGDEGAVFGAEGAWSRPTPGGATNGVLYLTVTSDSDDELVGVEVPAEVAAAAQLHETVTGEAGGGHVHGGGDGGGEVSMEAVETVAIGAGESFSFAPGASHVMLLDVADPLRLGERYTATLRFASGRSLDVEVVVADNPPA